MMMYFGSMDSGMNNRCAVKNGRIIFGMQSGSVRTSAFALIMLEKGRCLDGLKMGLKKG